MLPATDIRWEHFFIAKILLIHENAMLKNLININQFILWIAHF